MSSSHSFNDSHQNPLEPPPTWYPTVFKRYQALLNRYSHLYLALSAGVDSNVLLHFLHYYQAHLPPITTLHVNHNWHGEDSYRWANFAKKAAEGYGFSHFYFELSFPLDQGKTFEAEGREARYQLMAEFMAKNTPDGLPLLLTAHHRSDQAETLFHRLLRKSGLKGMGAMKDHTVLSFSTTKIEICRPLLSISKKELYKTAKKEEIPWQEDYTNHDVDVTRNQIRNGIFPLIEKYFPHYEEAFYQTSLYLQEAQTLHDEVASDDLVEVSSQLKLPKNSLSYPAVKALSKARLYNLIRFWLEEFHLSLSHRQFSEFHQSYFLHSPTTQSRFLIGDHTLFFFNDQLILIKNSVFQNKPEFSWIPASHAPDKTFWQQYPLEWVQRPKGVRFHPQGRAHSQTVKKLLQENNIPPWIRETLWVLRHKETHEIFWVEGLGLSEQIAKYDHNSKNGLIPHLIRS